MNSNHSNVRLVTNIDQILNNASLNKLTQKIIKLHIKISGTVLMKRDQKIRDEKKQRSLLVGRATPAFTV